MLRGVAVNGGVPNGARGSADAFTSAADSTGGAWWIYRGNGELPDGETLSDRLPPPPPWRDFDGGPVVAGPPPDDDAEIRRRLGNPAVTAAFGSPREADMVNAALFLRRPLIVTGPPGIGKSSLAHRVSRELGLGRVLRWTITSRSTLRQGLYEYDAVGRIQEATARDAQARAAAAEGAPGAAEDAVGIGDFIQLGPLGTALVPREIPRVLLIDEFDKADTDLANDLLGAFEEGEFAIPELSRVRSRMPEAAVHTDDPDGAYTVRNGRIRCRAFPFVVITSNGERTMPPAFLRRCLTLTMEPPAEDELAAILAAQFATAGDDDERTRMIRDFVIRAQSSGPLPTDQLMNAEYLRLSTSGLDTDSWNRLLHALWQRLDGVGSA